MWPVHTECVKPDDANKSLQIFILNTRRTGQEDVLRPVRER